MEMPGDSPEDGSGKDNTKKELQDPKQNLQLLLQRQAKFLESCREVKVSNTFENTVKHVSTYNSEHKQNIDIISRVLFAIYYEI